MKRNLILLLVVGLFCGCQVKNDDKTRPTNQESKVQINSRNTKNITDFHFTAKTRKDYINSKTGTYTRFYKADSKTVHFELTKKEQSIIQYIYFESKFDTLPYNFLPKSTFWRNNPDFDVDFVIYFNGKNKNLFVKSYYNPYYGRIDENTQKIINSMTGFYAMIYRIVFSKKEVKELKDSDL